MFQPLSSYGAQEDLTLTSSVTYDLRDSSGSIKATLLTSILNQGDDPVPIRSIVLSIPYRSASKLLVKYGSRFLETDIQLVEDGTKLTVDLNNEIARKNDPILITTTFEVVSGIEFTDKMITLPVDYSGTGLRSLELLVPDQLDAYMLTPYSDKSQRNGYIKYHLNDPSNDIYLNSGSSIPYRFEIEHQFDNTDTVPKKFHISLPPSDSKQLLSINTIDPLPESVSNDAEGNIELTYSLSANSSLSVKIIGNITKELALTPGTNNYFHNPLYSSPVGYWSISTTDTSLPGQVVWEDLTPSERVENINDIVSFVFEQLESSAEQELTYRLGGEVLKDGNTQATPQDYVDLTISLLRRNNTPARQVVGYTLDMLDGSAPGSTHTWVEYWDPLNGWTLLDTYEIDLKDDLGYKSSDLSRIVLMYRGLDPTFPQFNSYTLSNLSLTPLGQPFSPIDTMELTVSSEGRTIFESNMPVDIHIKNSGSTIIRSATLSTVTDLYDETFPSLIILPGQTYTIPIQLPVDHSEQIEMKVKVLTNRDTEITELISFTPQVTYPWWWYYMLNLINLVLFLSVVMVLIYFLRKLNERFRR